MTDKEKIRAEVERRLLLLVPKVTFQHQRKELENILSFIDSLPEDVSDDLEEAAVEYADWAIKQPKDFCISAIADYDNGITEGFKAGANWQKEKDTRDMLMSDNRNFKKVYELGKKDMKEQMMKSAIEAKLSFGQPVLLSHPVSPQIAKDGDKVKLIVVKDE